MSGLQQGVFQHLARQLSIDSEGQVSITFDAFTSLTLPLPPKHWSGYVFVLPLDPSKPRLRYTLHAPAETNIKQLKVLLGEKSGLNPRKVGVSCAKLRSS